MRHGGAVRTGGRSATRSSAAARSDADLARCGELEEQRADQAVTTLVHAAQVLVVAAGHDPDRVACASAGCLLSSTEHAGLCVLAHRLALLGEAPTVRSVLPIGAAVTEFRRTITAAVEAVQRCRVTRHAEGRCRFSVVPGQDGCAAVLQAAHQVG